MQISVPDQMTKNFQNTKNIFEQKVDVTINAINQTAKQAKIVVLDRTNQSIESINQMTENARVNVTEATNNTIGSVTEKTSQLINGITDTASSLQQSIQTAIDKIDHLNQTLSEGIQTSINSSLNTWIDNNAQLVWLINHPLQDIGILLLGLILFSGLLGAISNITSKFWLICLTYPFQLAVSGLELIPKFFQKTSDPQKDISRETEKQNRIKSILNRLENIREEQKILLEELESILKF